MARDPEARESLTFHGNVQLWYLSGPFAELTISRDAVQLRPRWWPRRWRLFEEVEVPRAEVTGIRVGGVMSRGVRVDTTSGAMDRYVFVPFSRRDRRRLREAVEALGYPAA